MQTIKTYRGSGALASHILGLSTGCPRWSNLATKNSDHLGCDARFRVSCSRRFERSWYVHFQGFRRTVPLHSETLGATHPATRRHTREHLTPQQHHCKALKITGPPHGSRVQRPFLKTRTKGQKYCGFNCGLHSRYGIFWLLQRVAWFTSICCRVKNEWSYTSRHLPGAHTDKLVY
jgi:hypothetical protein